MAGKLKLKGPKSKMEILKITVSMDRKRQAAKRATDAGLDLAAWVRLLLYRELDDPRPQ